MNGQKNCALLLWNLKKFESKKKSSNKSVRGDILCGGQVCHVQQ